MESVHIVGFDDHWSRYMKHFACYSDTNSSNPNWLQVGTSVLACELVAAGREYAVMIERFAKRLIETGRPIHIVGEPVPLHQSHFLVKTETATEEPVLAEAEAFKEWILAEFAG